MIGFAVGAVPVQAKRSERSIQAIGNRHLAGPTALGPPEEGFAAGRTVISLAFGLGPFNTPLFIAELGHLFTPQGDRAFHDPNAGGKHKVLDCVAWPLIALVTGVKSF